MLQAIEQRDVFPSEIKGIPRNPLTGDEPGYEYVQPKPRSEMEPAEFSKQVMIYQLRDGQRDTSLLVVFADGSEGFVD